MSVPAERFAATFHNGQLYDGIYSYFRFHIKGVAEKYCEMFGDETGRVVAVLHDVVEDTDCDLYMVRANFGDLVADAVDAITKRKGEFRSQYIDRCRANRYARDVKICDSIFNMEYSIKKGEFERASMYAKQIERLMK
ncbi:MAG: hypothetical protein ACRDBQ_15080 [Shewanella sp.]